MPRSASIIMAEIVLNPKHTALTLGAFSTIIHLIWFVLVAMGAGKGIMEWFHARHFFDVSFQILPFDIFTAIYSLVTAFVITAMAGWLFAVIWNYVARKV